MIIGNEIRSDMGFVMLSLPQLSVDVAQTNTGHSDNKRKQLPQSGTTCIDTNRRGGVRVSVNQDSYKWFTTRFKNIFKEMHV